MTVAIEYILAQSQTEETKVYTVTVVNALPVSCTCPSWAFSKDKPFVCKHMRYVWGGK